MLLKKVKQYQNYAKKISILGAELDRLSSLNKGLQEDNKTMRVKYANNMNIEMKEQDMNMKMVLEIESLRMRLKEREIS